MQSFPRNLDDGEKNDGLHCVVDVVVHENVVVYWMQRIFDVGLAQMAQESEDSVDKLRAFAEVEQGR